MTGSDKDMMQLVKEGSSEAMAILYDRYASRMLAFFYNHLQDQNLSQDLTQELFIKVIDNAHRYEAKYAFSTWVYTMAYNMIKNKFRDVSRRQNNFEGFMKDSELGPSSEPEDDYQKYLPIIDKAIHHLKPKLKTVFILRYKEEKSIKDIAEILRISEGTVKSRLHYAILRIRENVQPEHSKL